MLRLLVSWLLHAAVIVAVAHLVPGVSVASFWTAMVVAAVLGVLNVVLGPLLTFLGTALTLPAVLLSFGLFFFVVRFAVNVFLLWMTVRLVDGFSIADLAGYLWSALLIALFGAVLGALSK